MKAMAWKGVSVAGGIVLGLAALGLMIAVACGIGVYVVFPLMAGVMLGVSWVLGGGGFAGLVGLGAAFAAVLFLIQLMHDRG